MLLNSVKARLTLFYSTRYLLKEKKKKSQNPTPIYENLNARDLLRSYCVHVNQ